MKGNLGTGLNYLWRGFELIKQPGLRLFVLLPLSINVLVFGVLIYASIGQFSEWINAALGWLPGWLDFLSYVMWPAAVLLLLTVVMYSFSLVANLIASPFNGLLSEKVEELLTGEPVPGPENLGEFLAIVPRSLMREVQKLLYYLPLALAALIISLIFSPIAPVIWFLLGAWMMVIQYCDYPMDNHLVGFKEMKKTIALKRLTSSGFGAGVMAGTMIPIVNFIIMPVAICGATAYWVDEMRERHKLESK